MPKPPPRYLTTPEAARELSVNERTLRHWVATGQIEPDFRTAGGHMRWDVERVRAELRAGLRDRRDADEE
ncbi:MAG: helix-turn-helix domain-containing protein [Pseudonocardia sp.]|uniref:MerR family DNA-binding transcriptional regulator n=1 Tax=Actinomycetes TaxID=1760 RepID=UPI00086D1741|nr:MULTISPECIES: MerR family DNA-binding transcriptional regulator [Actinomycetes]MBN9108545.1 helix-turn-helix domain-containing protein [Pseudonocardia sp.]ODU27492.1 MAG: MerR family transcriptional regulator [Pseudonocardia sp. SCN 72-51]ODV07930.1 MAG: MerR family transcriptional regulator [Pseudonocardia sp. SCN 73-27]